MPARLVTVVGVSRDVAGFRFVDTQEAGLFLPTSVHAPATAVVARVRGESELVHRTLVDHLTRVDPNMGLIVTMRTVARLETFFLQIAFWVSLVLGGLALLLTVSGLFSVLSYLVEQRTQGDRRADGARRVVPESGAPGPRADRRGRWPTGWWPASDSRQRWPRSLIALPAGAEITEIVRVTDPIAYVASLLVIVAACLLAAWIPAARAARLDPMRTLRQE